MQLDDLSTRRAAYATYIAEAEGYRRTLGDLVAEAEAEDQAGYARKRTALRALVARATARVAELRSPYSHLYEDEDGCLSCFDENTEGWRSGRRHLHRALAHQPVRRD